jgi:chromosome segregation ATPase
MRLKGKLTATLLLCVALLCSACGESELRSYAKKTHEAAVSLRAAFDTKQTLVKNGQITREEAERVNPFFLDAASALETLNNRVDELNQKFDDANRRLAALDRATPDYEARRRSIEDEKKSIERSASASVRPLAAAFARSVRELNEKGVLHVKNTDARALLSTALSAVEAHFN